MGERSLRLSIMESARPAAWPGPGVPLADARADCGDLGDRLQRPLGRLFAPALGGQAGEVALEARRRTHYQVPAWGLAEVGVGVRHPRGARPILPPSS